MVTETAEVLDQFVAEDIRKSVEEALQTVYSNGLGCKVGCMDVTAN
jgi:hypothetical protein